MSNTVSGAEKPLSKIFYKDYDFIIPPYQRPYSWEVEEAEELFDDLYEFFCEQEKVSPDKKEVYFLGSIVIVKAENNTRSEVIDGQQRLTTLTILFSCLADMMEGSSRDNIKAYVLEPGNDIERIEPKPRLTLRARDNEFFKRHIQNFKISELIKLKKGSLESDAQTNIMQNAELFHTKLKQLTKDSLKDFASFLVKQCYLVVVSTSSQDSAFRIFSVMNNRGKDLLPSDILKAELIGKLSNAKEQDQYNNKWEELEVRVGREDFSSLFNHIRMIYSKEKLRTSLVDGFKEKVVKKEKDAKKIINDVINVYADAYIKVKNKKYDSVPKVEKSLKWLSRISGSDWVPCALIALNSKLDDSVLEEYFKKLETLAAFLLITGKNVNEKILRYKPVLEEMEKFKKTPSRKIKAIELSSSEKKEFIEALNGDIYTFSSPKKKYIILRLDSFLGDGGAVYDSNVLTIEHVLPQTVDPKSQWAKDWQDVAERESWVHKIANLFPLNKTRNVVASNHDFKKKIKAYFDGNKKVSTYALTTQIINAKEWTPGTVKKRQKDLMKIFKDNWEL